MTTRQDAIDAAEALGVRIYDDGATVGILAPTGMTFNSGFHEHAWRYGRGEYTKREIWGDAVDLMRPGLLECDIDGCEWCADPNLPHGVTEASIITTRQQGACSERRDFRASPCNTGDYLHD